MISTVAGQPYLAGKKTYQYDGDGGPALRAKFSGVYCLAFSPSGDKLFIADLENRRVRVLDTKTGQVDLVAGNGKSGVPNDGAVAKEAPLVDPRACAVDANGNLYILERSGHALRVVDKEGRIRTVAGTGKRGLSGDGGDALQATLDGPKHLTVDRNGDVIIADSANHVIRRYSPSTGVISRIAGTGKKGPSGNGGDALTTSLNEPHGVFVHPSGTLYIVDSNNDRVFRLTK
jgi:sugar lactone lactonase YvrE